MPGRKPNPWLVLCLVCIAQFMVVLDATIVNVALPSIQTDLKLAENADEAQVDTDRPVTELAA